jgi:hypothetical protein
MVHGVLQALKILIILTNSCSTKQTNFDTTGKKYIYFIYPTSIVTIKNQLQFLFLPRSVSINLKKLK